MSEYRDVIANHSGRLSLKRGETPFEDGVWLVIEDAQDICSIGMTASEVELLIAALREFVPEGNG